MDKKELKTKVIYQAFIRNETKEGTIKKFIGRLDWIKSLNVDIVYLLPVQTIGKKGRKGSLGCPYAIKDYKEMNCEYGSWDDYKLLVEEIHKRGMLVMQDIVFNHVSKDSNLFETHPEFIFKDKNGVDGNKVGAWSDVSDLDYSGKGLDDYLISVLQMFKDYGVDGFRFDVASLIPAWFFNKARKALGDDLIFLAECIDTPFIMFARSLNVNACSNSELAENGFDLFYPYGDWFAFEEYKNHGFDAKYLNQYKVAMNMEQANLPIDKYIMLSIENHDRDRIASYSNSDAVLHNLLTYSFSIKGPAFIYSGEELKISHLPSLFDKDTIDLDKKDYDTDYLEFVKHLISLKQREKNLGLLTSEFPFTDDDYMLVINTYENKEKEYGLFAFDNKKHHATAKEIPAGLYLDLISNSKIEVKESGIIFKEPLLLVKEK